VPSDLAEALAVPPQKGEDAPGFEFDPSTGRGKMTTKPLKGEPDPYAALREFGEDPDLYTCTPVKIKRWNATLKGGTVGDWLTSGTFLVTKKMSEVPLPSLFEAARKKTRDVNFKTRSDRTEVVVISDFQIGKVNENGGWPELLDVLMEKVALLDAHLRKVKPKRIKLFDLGDLLEGDQTGAGPERNLDLSHPEQLDAGATILYEFVNVCVKYAETEVATVPSNHTRWRDGKQNLGKPGDDYGIHIHRQVEKQFAGRRVSWVYPKAWDESLLVDVDGLRVGLFHGHLLAKGKGNEWWAKQMHGGGAIAQADVLLTGHYHHFYAMPTGRNFNGVQKWWLQAPHCETGSAWFRNQTGESSDGGIMTFGVVDGTFSMSRLQIL